METMAERWKGRFITTRWGVIKRASEPDGGQALAAVCESYWYPVYSFIRCQDGVGSEEARDITQGFFADILTRNDLAKVDPALGRFRSWIRKAAFNHLRNVRKWDRAKKRGGGAVPFSIDVECAEERLRLEPKDSLTPDRLFDRRWAMLVMDRALSRLCDEYTSSEKHLLFTQLLQILSDDQSAMTDAELAALLGKKPGAVRTDRCRLKDVIETKYRDYLRAEIRATGVTASEIRDELRQLVEAIDLPDGPA